MSPGTTVRPRRSMTCVAGRLARRRRRIADGREAAVADGHRARDGVSRVHRVDASVDENQVGRRSLPREERPGAPAQPLRRQPQSSQWPRLDRRRQSSRERTDARVWTASINGPGVGRPARQRTCASRGCSPGRCIPGSRPSRPRRCRSRWSTARCRRPDRRSWLRSAACRDPCA